MSALLVLMLGELVEQRQEKKQQASAWSYEDLQSNLQGAIFGKQFRGLEGEAFYKALANYLNKLEAGSLDDAPNKNDIPDERSREYGEVPQNRTYTPIYTSGDDSESSNDTSKDEEED